MRYILVPNARFIFNYNNQNLVEFCFVTILLEMWAHREWEIERFIITNIFHFLMIVMDVVLEIWRILEKVKSSR